MIIYIHTFAYRNNARSTLNVCITATTARPQIVQKCVRQQCVHIHIELRRTHETIENFLFERGTIVCVVFVLRYYICR